MVDPFSVAAGIGTNLATNLLIALARPDFRSRLAREAVQRVPAFPVSKRKLQRWLDVHERWQLIADGSDASIDAISSTLCELATATPTRKIRRLSDGDLERHATEMAHVLCRDVLSLLDVPTALAVHDERSERRHRRQLEANDPDLYRAHLARLPPAAAVWVDEVARSDRLDGRRLAETLAARRDAPDSLVAEVAADATPSRLANLTWAGWEAVASFLGAYGLPDAVAVERAIALGSPAERHACWAALRCTADGAPPSTAVAALGDPKTDGPFAAATRAVIAGDLVAYREQVSRIDRAELTPHDHRLLGQLEITACLHRSDTAGAISRARELCEALPGWASPQQQLGQLLAVDSAGMPTGGIDQQRVRGEAVEALRRAIGASHGWGAPNVDATRLLINLLLTLDDVDAALAAASTPPTGTAHPAEAADPEISGQRSVLEALLERPSASSPTAAPYFAAIRRAVLASSTDERIRHLEDAATVASEPHHGVMAHVQLAKLGRLDESFVEDLGQREPAAAALICALAAVHDGDLERSIALLAPFAERSEPHAQLLAETHDQRGHPAKAAAVLAAAAAALRNDTLAGQAVSALLRSGATDDAERLAYSLLAEDLPSGAGSRYLRRTLTALALQRRDFEAAKRRATLLLDRFPDETQAVWTIVFADYQSGHFKAAWSTVQRYDAQPVDEATAIMLIQLIGFHDPSEEGAERILDIAHRHPSSEQVNAAAVTNLVQHFGQAALTAATRLDVQAVIADFLATFPDSPFFYEMSGESVEDLLIHLREHLEPRARAGVALADRVRAGQLPFGLIADFRDQHMNARTFADSTRGLLSVVSEAGITRAAELLAASQALGRAVVIDLTVPMITATTPELDLAGLLGHFGAVITTDTIAADAHRSLQVVEAGGPGTTISFDPETQRFLHSETDPASHQEHLRVLNAIADRINAAERRPCPELPTDLERDAFGAWIDPVALAQHEHLALYSDDACVRKLARHLGIHTFGTHALLHACLERGTVEPATVLAFERLLVERGYGEVPTAAGHLNDLLNDRDFTALDLLPVVMRPSFWRQHPKPFELFKSLVDILEQIARSDIAAWTYAAALGAGLAAPPDRADSVMATVMTLAVIAVDGDPTTTADIVAAGRRAGTHVSLDPTPALIRDLWNLLHNAPPDAARQVLVTTFSETPDVQIHLTRTILGLSPAAGLVVIDDNPP